MILLNVLKAAGDRTVESGKYMWSSFGDSAHSMDFKDVDDTVYCSAVFDIKTQEVFCITIEVPGYNQAFRWLNPDYRQKYYDECVQKRVDPDIAWDNVNYTHIETEELILEYVKDVGETYYDNLPPPPHQIPTLDIPVLENEEMWSQRVIDEPSSFTMPMPGTMGSATYKFGDGFQNEKKMNQFKVKLIVQMDYAVDATTMDEAASKARKWFETSKVFHGEGEDVYWEDRFVVEETVSRAVEE